MAAHLTLFKTTFIYICKSPFWTFVDVPFFLFKFIFLNKIIDMKTASFFARKTETQAVLQSVQK